MSAAAENTLNEGSSKQSRFTEDEWAHLEYHRKDFYLGPEKNREASSEREAEKQALRPANKMAKRRNYYKRPTENRVLRFTSKTGQQSRYYGGRS